MGSQNLSLIKPTSKSKTIQGHSLILQEVKKHYDMLPNKHTLLYVPSFLLYIASLIEECYKNKRNLDNGKVDKKNELFLIVGEFLNVSLTEEQRRIISEIVEDLHSSNRIKPFRIHSQLFHHVSKFFLKTVI